MAVPKFLLWVLRSVFSNMLMVCDELDEATCDHMQQHSEMLTEELALTLQELEQKIQEQRSKKQDRVTWRAVLFAAFWTLQFWVIADILLLLIVGLCWQLRKRGHKVGSSSKEEEDSEEEDAAEVTDLDMYVTMHKWSVDKL